MASDFDEKIRAPRTASLVYRNPPLFPPKPRIDDVDNVDVELAPAAWVEKVMEKLTAPSSCRHAQPTIFRVPHNLRSCDPPAYTPRVVSIGPYHHPNNSTSLFPNHDDDIASYLQGYQRHCVRFLLSRSEAEARSLLNSCLTRIKGLIPHIRSCYSADDVGLTDHDLAESMLLDGCFIITRLLKQQQQQQQKPNVHPQRQKEEDGIQAAAPLLSMPWIWKLVDYDLLKLENQIPFFVLEALFGLLKTPAADGDVNLVDLALKLFHEIRPFPSISSLVNRLHLGEDCQHLLHLFYSSLLPSPTLQALEDGNHDHGSLSCEWIPSATELRRAGVAFRENDQGNSFLDVSFEDGVTRIPRLSIFDYTKPLFRNLIAFEQCYPFPWTRITTYAVFMDCLVDTAQDVNRLRLSGVLLNRLSTDQDVADLFNTLTDQVHYDLDRNYLHQLFIEVNRYHQSKWHRYRAGLMRDYFSSPWAIISVIAAAIVILLTALQAFYAVYDYHGQT